MYYHFKVHKDKDGYWAECIELEGCHSQGNTKSELFSNIHEALNLYLSEPHESKAIFPMPSEKKPRGKNIVLAKVEPSVAFAFLLRMARLKRKMTIRKMAEFLNYKNTNTYAKLEKAKTSNPELKTLGSIINKIPDFPIDILFKA